MIDKRLAVRVAAAAFAVTMTTPAACAI